MGKFLMGFWQVLSGLLILLTSFIIIASPEGYIIVLFILSIIMLVFAIRQLWFYFTMARFMVGGISILFEGIIALDFAIFLLSLNNINSDYIMIYLIVIYLASGCIDMFRAFEIKKLNDKSWKRKAAFGIFNLIIALLCLIFIQSDYLLCTIYGFGLFLNGIRRIIKPFKKTDMVYIQ